MMGNIILIGMPGAGKSTAGVLLAKTLGMDFTDTDLLMQQQSGLLLFEMLQRLGLEGFLCAEEAAVCSLRCENTVVATGGSVVYSENTMEHLKEIGTVVFLSVRFREIQRRLHNIRTRGIAMPPGTTLRGLYDERSPLYRKYADITVDCSGGDIEKTVLCLMREIEKRDTEADHGQKTE